MSAIDSTDKIRSDIEGLLADREALLALRKVLDGHRHVVPHNGGLVRHETDEEVIARLRRQHSDTFFGGCHFQDETGRALGVWAGVNDGVPYLETDDAHGRAYAKGFWNGLSYTEGRDGAVIGTPSYDRNGAKVGSDSFGSGGVQSWGSVRPAMPSTPKPEPLTDQRRDELRATGRKAHAHGGKRPDPMAWSVSLFAASLDEVLELQHGWDEADASVRGLAPKPIRLHSGQVWGKDGEERVVGDLLGCGYVYPEGGSLTPRQYKRRNFVLTLNEHRDVIDSHGWVLIAGPGFTG